MWEKISIPFEKIMSDVTNCNIFGSNKAYFHGKCNKEQVRRLPMSEWRKKGKKPTSG